MQKFPDLHPVTHKEDPMAKNQNAGITIKGKSVNIGGDVIAGNKITTQNFGLTDEFEKIRKLIKNRPNDSSVDKKEINLAVDNIENEVKKGDKANLAKVERWLKFLAAMADDIFQVTAATLTNPVAGVVKTIQLVVQKAKEKP